ncbi:histidine kinase [Microbacterium sp. OR21]|uniref:sensor histidine kinase n=1 Tax=Microbacterium sp. OR21 TaxID=3095346 RepID=UPI0039B386F0
MSSPRSRSSDVVVDDGLRLPRPPGVIRRFWARHPLFADILIALICLTASFGVSAIPDEPGQVMSPAASAVLGLVTIASCVLLVWRRTRTTTAVVAAIIVDLTLLMTAASTGSPMFTVAVYTVAVYRSTRLAWVWLGGGCAAVTALALAMLLGGDLTLQDLWNAMLSVTVPGVIGVLIGMNIGGRRRYVEAIIDRSRQLLVERDQQAQLAAAAERDRIAREMHDIVSHSLTVVVALSEGAAATDDRGRSRDASLAAARTARSALAEMRSMLGVLRDGDSDASLAPLEPASPAATVAAAQAAGFPASIAVRGEPDPAPAVRFAVGRIVQEGVTNAIRHAPSATAIDVRIDHAATPLIVEIVNDGATGEPSEAGFGLRGLAERAALLGGRVVSAPAGAGRWMLRAELPHRTRELLEGAES